MPMLIADAQVHIWAANTPERPWVVRERPYKPHRPVPFTKDDLLREMDVAGVHRAILVPPPLEGFRNDLVLDAARSRPDRFAVMGAFNVKAPDARGRIANWLQQPGMLGLRLSFKIQGDASDDWIWEEAAAARVPIMMSSRTQLNFLERAATRNPEVKLVVDHLGISPPAKDDVAFADIDTLLALAKCPNIAVKASALPCHTSDTYPYRRLHPIVRRVYDAFGPRRMFWGTDLTRLPCTYRQAISLFTEELPWLTSEDKEWIMGRGLCEWVGWKV